MLLALKPPSFMQHDIKTSPRLGHIHEYSTSAHSYKPAHSTATISRYSPPESPRHLPSFFTNGSTHSAPATNGDSAMSSSSGHGHSYSHQPPPPPSSSHHRGLPPPSAGFSLPPPTPVSTDPHYRSSSAASLPPPAPPQSQHHGPSPGSTLGTLPAPPQTWSSTAASNDEAMRNWLHAKIEEDRRKQEEEKTRQENLRLDRRRMERDMLHESLERGIPPVMVPLIFAGIGTGSETTLSQAMEFAQTWMQNFSLQQQTPSSASDAQRLAYEQQLRQQGALLTSASSPDIRRERDQRELRDRMIPPNPYAAAASQQQPVPHSSDRASFRASFSGATPGGSSSALSKLNTVDFAPPVRHQPSLHPSLSASNLSLRSERDDLQSTPSGAPATASSASAQGSGGAALFFHHWTPPTGGSGGSGGSGATSAPPSGQQQPPTPSTKSMQGSPFGSQGSATGGNTSTSATHGHLRKQGGPSTATASDAVYENSPKKRKTTHSGGPSSQPGSGSSGGSAADAERGGGPVSQSALAVVRAQVAQEEEDFARRGGGQQGRRGSEEGSDRGGGRSGPGDEVLRPSSRQLRREEEEQSHQQYGRRYEGESGRPPDR